MNEEDYIFVYVTLVIDDDELRRTWYIEILQKFSFLILPSPTQTLHPTRFSYWGASFVYVTLVINDDGLRLTWKFIY